MQTPAPRATVNSTPNDTDDRTVLLTTRAIRAAAQPARPTPTPAPPSPPRSGYSSGPYRPGPPMTKADPAAGQDAADEAEDAPKFALTSTQVIASMSAAIVAAFIGAQLGVAGTIAGAAIASVVSVVGSAVIGHSLLLTRRKVTQTVQYVRGGAGSPADDDATVLLTAVTRKVEIEHVARTARTAPGVSKPTRRGWWRRPGRLRWMLIGVAASVAVFAGALGAVTAVEAVKGAPISGGESGFSVLGGNSGRATGSVDLPSSSSPTTVTETTTVPPSTASSAASSTRSSASTTSSSAVSATGSTAGSSTTTAPTSSAPATTSPAPTPAVGTGAAATSAG